MKTLTEYINKGRINESNEDTYKFSVPALIDAHLLEINETPDDGEYGKILNKISRLDRGISLDGLSFSESDFIDIMAPEAKAAKLLEKIIEILEDSKYFDSLYATKMDYIKFLNANKFEY